MDASRLLRSRVLTAAVIGATVAALVLGVRLTGALQGSELALYDLFLRFRSPGVSSESRVVLIRVLEEDLRRFGFPLADGVLAGALEVLSSESPRAIGVDILRDRPVGEGSERLAAIVASNPRITMIERHRDERSDAVRPPYFLRGRSQVGFADLVLDPGGITRRGLLLLYAEGEPFFSLPFKLALDYLSDQGITSEPDPDNPQNVRLGATTIGRFYANDGSYVTADDGGYQFLLDFRHGRVPFPSYSLSSLLDGDFDPSSLRGKAVLLGATAASVGDVHDTPFNTGRGELAGFYGLEVQAHALDQLLRHALDGDPPIRSWSELGEAAWTLAWGILAASVALWLRSSLVSGVALAASVAILFVSGFVAFEAAWWIPVLPPVGACLASGVAGAAVVSLREQAERRQIMDMFGRFVSGDVARELWKQRDEFMREERPSPQRLTVTVLMSDLKGFASAAEAMSPPQLLAWINTYMEAMAQVVEEHGGIVDDYAGDGLKADFGVPVPRTTEEEIRSDALHAVQCALAMGETLERLNQRWRREELPTARVRIGIYTGDAVVGTLGSARRLKYTTLGDDVNVAARLESFDKESFDHETDSCRILIGESTRLRVSDRIRTEHLGKHFLKGKKEAIGIHRVLGLSGRPKENRT